MTWAEGFDLLSKAGGPVGVAVFVAFVLLQLFSERVAKALGPILGAIGRWWHGREERAEEELQRLLRARRVTEEQETDYQLTDMRRQLAYFAEVMDALRDENKSLRDEVRSVHALLDEARRAQAETHQAVSQIRHTLDTGERLAVLPPPPPTVAGRHRHNTGEQPTTRINRQEAQ
jgi:hypothetical protein